MEGRVGWSELSAGRDWLALVHLMDPFLQSLSLSSQTDLHKLVQAHELRHVHYGAYLLSLGCRTDPSLLRSDPRQHPPLLYSIQHHQYSAQTLANMFVAEPLLCSIASADSSSLDARAGHPSSPLCRRFPSRSSLRFSTSSSTRPIRWPTTLQAGHRFLLSLRGEPCFWYSAKSPKPGL